MTTIFSNLFALVPAASNRPSDDCPCALPAFEARHHDGDNSATAEHRAKVKAR